ncbi:unnamed protein product [Adineta ricciae]|uniref:Uncharacterized protein n=1 Tax=Adineta ricciae TaxID=249248 RepID=A0A816F320_ADIRI|nr:unnamed protein product [Adineta ricciae]
MVSWLKNKLAYGIFQSDDDNISTDQQHKNKENVAIIWLNPNADRHSNVSTTLERLRQVNDFVYFSRNITECITHVTTVPQEIIILITSNIYSCDILSQIGSSGKVDSIVIFCLEEDISTNRLDQYSKVIGVYSQLDDLLALVRKRLI